MIRVFCALLCLSLLSSCNTKSAGNLLMMPVKLGQGLLKTATRTLGRVAETDSEGTDQQEIPKPHSRLPGAPKINANETTTRLAVIATESPST